jgi:cellulose synthase
VLRRAALVQLGIAGSAKQVEQTFRSVLTTADIVLAKARDEAKGQGPSVLAALGEVAAAVFDARQELRKPGRRAPIDEVTHRFRLRVDAASQGLVDAAGLFADLSNVGELERSAGRHAAPVTPALDDNALHRLARKDVSPLRALATVRALVDAVDVSRSDEAQPIFPMPTVSSTEDMATAVRLHAMGWKSAYHHENLVNGRAPADLGTVLQQRLRRAEGSLEVLLEENPLGKRGLPVGQRLMYFATMWSYLSGFFAPAYLVAPVVFLCFDVHPLISCGPDFLIRLIPYLVASQLLAVVVGGRWAWRSAQYGVALFPLWIRAAWTAFGNVVFRGSPGFVVPPTPKQEQACPPWRLIWPQLAATVLLVSSAAVGITRYLMGSASYDLLSLVVNLVWAVGDVGMLSVVISAAAATSPEPQPRKARVTA